MRPSQRVPLTSHLADCERLAADAPQHDVKITCGHDERNHHSVPKRTAGLEKEPTYGCGRAFDGDWNGLEMAEK
jgi:predicted dehydrogenase